MLSIYSVTYLYGYHQPYAQSCSSEWLFLFLVLIRSTPVTIGGATIRKASKIRLRLFLEDLADYCEWHSADCLTY